MSEDFCESQSWDAFVQREIPRFCSFLAGDPAIESSGFAWIYWHSAGGSRSKLRIISLRLFYRHRRIHHALGFFRKFLLIQDHLFRGFRRTSFRNGEIPRFCNFSGWPKHCTFWIWKHLLALADDYTHTLFLFRDYSNHHRRRQIWPHCLFTCHLTQNNRFAELLFKIVFQQRQRDRRPLIEQSAVQSRRFGQNNKLFWNTWQKLYTVRAALSRHAENSKLLKDVGSASGGKNLMRSLVVKSETIFQCESNEPLANFLVFFFFSGKILKKRFWWL